MWGSSLDNNCHANWNCITKIASCSYNCLKKSKIVYFYILTFQNCTIVATVLSAASLIYCLTKLKTEMWNELKGAAIGSGYQWASSQDSWLTSKSCACAKTHHAIDLCNLDHYWFFTFYFMLSIKPIFRPIMVKACWILWVSARTKVKPVCVHAWTHVYNSLCNSFHIFAWILEEPEMWPGRWWLDDPSLMVHQEPVLSVAWMVDATPDCSSLRTCHFYHEQKFFISPISCLDF